MRVQNYEEAVKLLLPRLKDYLESQNISTVQNFKCLSPNHEDKSPSCGLTPNGEAWNCFGCGATGTIFNACAILEKRAATGPEFASTLAYLAEKYDVPLKHEEPTEEELYRIDTYKAYRIAGELVVNGTPTEEFIKAIEARKWSTTLCNQLGIGCIKDFKEFKDNLRLAGFTQKFLAEVDLNRDTIFGPDRLIFTIRDEHGSPVGFASRNLNFGDEGNGESKYVNQRGTGVKCNIYQKSKRLFGLDRFLKDRGKKQTPLYIFEGYSDVATAAEFGLWNCVGIGGTALTTDHIHLLKEKNVYDLILCLDGDDPGQEATARLLDTILSGHKDLNVKIVFIPEGMDPDEFIRKEGLPKFKKLKKHSAFEWRLSKFDDDADPETMCKKMIPLIVNERSYVKQEKMAHELANITGFTLKTVQKELDRLQNRQEAQKARDVSEVGEKLVEELKKDPQNIQHFLREADISMYDLSKKYEEDSFSEESLVSRIRSQKEHEESLDGSFSGFVLGDSMGQLQEALAGNWKKDVWFVVGGKANSGKTSLMCKLAWEIARHEKENDPLVIYHTIDDTFEQVLPKFVALAADTTNLELNMIMNPKYAVKNTGNEDNEIIDNRNDGYNQVIDLAKRGRLIIKDANDGISLSFADNMIRRFKEKHPERNVVYILDNFHKLEDFQNVKGDERVRFKTLSKVVKGLATKYHIPVITTVEYRKTEKGKRAESGDILECLTGDTQIFLPDTSSYIRLDDVKEGMKVATLDDKTQKIVARRVTKLWNKGIQQVYKVTTKTGRTLKTTMNHPFFSDNGWTKLSDLKEESWIGIPQRLPSCNYFVSQKTKDISRFLGYMAGDGSYLTTPSFTNKDKEYYQDVINIAEKYFEVTAKTYNHFDSKEISFSRNTGTLKTNEIKMFFEKIGIWGQKGEQKEIPTYISEGSIHQKAHYIAGLFASDGSVQSGESPRVSFSNKSIFLIKGLQSMLLQFGIQSRRSKEKDGMNKIVIKNRFIYIFAKSIPLLGRKGTSLKELLDPKQPTGGGNVLPPAYTEKLKELRKASQKPVRLTNEFWIQKPTISKENAKLYISETKCDQCLPWIQGDVYWDQIKSIEKLDSQQTWDLTVEDTHNFIANDIFCHNTGQIEYDTNLIAHVYNEAHELGANATSVHRGPNGEKLPIIELEIAKNKITSFKDKIHFQFWPASSRFNDITPQLVQHYKQVEKDKLGQDSSAHKEAFVKCANLAKEKEWQSGKVYWLLFDELGLSKDDQDDKDTVGDIWNKFGSKVGVEKIWNS